MMATPIPEPFLFGLLQRQSYLNQLGLTSIPIGYSIVSSSPDFTPRLIPTAQAYQEKYIHP